MALWWLCGGYIFPSDTTSEHKAWKLVHHSQFGERSSPAVKARAPMRIGIQLENVKKICQKFLRGRLWKNKELILINMFSPTVVPNLVTLAWKMSSAMPKEASLLNGPSCAYLIRQNLIKLVWDLRAMNVLATFQNDLRKFIDVRALVNSDFPSAKLKNAKKNRQIFRPLWKKRNLYWLTCLAQPLYQIWWLKLQKWVRECQKRPAH